MLDYFCHASAFFSLYKFLHFYMRTYVIPQAHIVEVSFALLQYVYPNLITSMPSMLCALARVASDMLSYTQFGKETCQVVFYMLFYKSIGSHVSAGTSPSLMGSPLFLRFS